MKRSISIALLLAVGACAWAFAQQAGQPQMPKPKPSTPAFDQIKSLAGEWEGKMSDGSRATTSYRVVSNQSAVLNLLGEGSDMEMVTMFHQDGPALMVTHYCAVGNQPRMVAKTFAKPNVLEFTFKDVTNAGQEGHMVGLVLTIVDRDHHRQEWTFRQNGKDQREVFEFTRKR